jgi:transposase
MNHVSGIAREQITLFPEALEDYISAENPVRFLDAFVDKLEMARMGFRDATVHETGRPPYNPKDLLKLYVFGYLIRIRSSRLLERESKRNLEVDWLLKRLSTDHRTISDFRKDHGQALHEVFKQFVVLCKQLDLFGAELVAIDSTKFKASNARDRVKDNEQLNKSLAHIKDSITQYLAQLDQNDRAEEPMAHSGTPLSKEQLQKKIASLQQQPTTLEEARRELEENGEKYRSLTDPDCRLMKNERRNEPAYAMQAAVDAKHSLIIDFALTQDAADHNHLSPVAAAAKRMLGVDVCSSARAEDLQENPDAHTRLLSRQVRV